MEGQASLTLTPKTPANTNNIHSGFPREGRVYVTLFSDASTKPLVLWHTRKTVQGNGQVYIGFVLRKKKPALQSGLTIPRLELCAAVLAVEKT